MEAPSPALRVSQLDAASLDKELNDICIDQWRKVISYLPVNFLSRLEPEMEAMMKSLFWYYVYRNDGATIGQRMMDMHYRKWNNGILDRRVKWTYLVLTAVLPWIRERLPSILGWRNENLKMKSDQWLDKCSTLMDVANLIHFLLFLNRGGFSTVLERILGIRAVHNSQPYLEEFDTEWTERELLWHGFSDLLVFFIPLINYRRFYNSVLRIGNTLRRWSKTGEDQGDKNGGPVNTVDTSSSCPYCEQSLPIIPCHLGCFHAYCYYCLAANLKADEKYSCAICGYSSADGNVVFVKGQEGRQ